MTRLYQSPFRGRAMPGVRGQLWQHRRRIKREAQNRQCRYSLGFAYRLRLWKHWSGGDRDFWAWPAWEGFPSHRPGIRHKKRLNVALERILDVELPF